MRTLKAPVYLPSYYLSAVSAGDSVISNWHIYIHTLYTVFPYIPLPPSLSLSLSLSLFVLCILCMNTYYVYMCTYVHICIHTHENALYISGLSSHVYVLFVFMLLHYFCLVDCEMFLAFVHLMVFGWFGMLVCCWHVVIPFAFDK